MTLLIAIAGGGGNWAHEAWRRRFADALPDTPVVFPDAARVARDAVRYAAVWNPERGLLAQFPKLDVIFNLGAGVDHLLADPTVPQVPIVRVVHEDLSRRMAEYVVWQVLDHHRQGRLLRTAQRDRVWASPEQVAASSLTVGLMGLGAIATPAIAALTTLGFQLTGWSRSERAIAGVRTFAGASQLPAFLAATDILVVLLPLTDDTRGIIDRRLVAGLKRNGPLGAPVLINAGRGGLQVEADITAALDDGTLGAATLDVFETEPLPPASPLWAHPRVTITPHNAADSDPGAIARVVAAGIAAHRAGRSLNHVVDRTRGY
jgi:glyoxylate/hydroxypyruvate reductase A